MAVGRIHVGTGGWTYAPWRETFYPPGLPHARELEYAGRHLTGIEINATYYRRMTAASYAKWRDTVPEGFRFTLKGSRFCTNRKALGEAAEGIANFLAQGVAELGDKLGPINWQLMDTKRFDPDEIAAFFALLPASHEGVPLRHAIEARHASFIDPAFTELARRAGVAIVTADAPHYASIDERTVPFVYARLQNARPELETGYPDAELDGWATRVRDWAAEGHDVFCYFINGAKERAPAAAMALLARLRDA